MIDEAHTAHSLSGMVTMSALTVETYLDLPTENSSLPRIFYTAAASLLDDEDLFQSILVKAQKLHPYGNEQIDDVDLFKNAQWTFSLALNKGNEKTARKYPGTANDILRKQGAAEPPVELLCSARIATTCIDLMSNDSRAYLRNALDMPKEIAQEFPDATIEQKISYLTALAMLKGNIGKLKTAVGKAEELYISRPNFERAVDRATYLGHHAVVLAINGIDAKKAKTYFEPAYQLAQDAKVLGLAKMPVAYADMRMQ